MKKSSILHTRLAKSTIEYEKISLEKRKKIEIAER